MAAIVALHALSKEYETDAGPVPVLKALELAIDEGEFVAVMGPSGSGKSTLMNILGCLDVPSSGQYILNARDVGALTENELAAVRSQVIGFVFQGFNLLARATLTVNVALPLVYQRVSKIERRARAADILKQVGLGDRLDSLPPRISGGQQQRVAIARALVTHPRLILADEPTGNLDTATGREIMGLFQRINRDSGITIIVVTHDIHVASFASRLVYLVDGVIRYDGKVSDFDEGQVAA